jgi:hypothetical protein
VPTARFTTRPLRDAEFKAYDVEAAYCDEIRIRHSHRAAGTLTRSWRLDQSAQSSRHRSWLDPGKSRAEFSALLCGVNAERV